MTISIRTIGYIRNEPVQIGFEDPLMIWREIDSLDKILSKVQSAIYWLMSEKQAHISDITVLVPDHHEGQVVLDFLRRMHLEVNHIFDNPSDSHSHKSTFEMGVGKLKICTAHSFKGWELSNIIILTPHEDQAAQGGTWSHHLFYAAITRVKRNLIVFNRYEGYRNYGNSWKQFV
jgi:superfamily I DNA/RNA helicase